MRLLPCLLAALALAFASPAPVRAENAAPLVLTTLRPASPCAFFRIQAYGKGLDDQATEMLWACEAIAARRAAEMPLGVRLEATELALERYREALHLVTRGGFATAAGGGLSSTFPSDADGPGPDRTSSPAASRIIRPSRRRGR